jgi:hypothetical protein
MRLNLYRLPAATVLVTSSFRKIVQVPVTCRRAYVVFIRASLSLPLIDWTAFNDDPTPLSQNVAAHSNFYCHRAAHRYFAPETAYHWLANVVRAHGSKPTATLPHRKSRWCLDAAVREHAAAVRLYLRAEPLVFLPTWRARL